MAHVNVVTLAATRAFDIDTLVIPTQHLSIGALVTRTPRAKAVRWLSRRLYPTADRIIAVSGGVADSITDKTTVDRREISVLYNPIDVEFVRNRAQEQVSHEWFEDEDTKVILFVGRLKEQKDLETWLRTFKRVHERDPNTRAMIVGKGPLQEDLLSFAEDLGIDDVVSMPGYVENQYGYMSRADLFFLSSRLEGLPTVLIEAMACGCPVVATDCPSGPEEILADGEYGPLAPVGDVDRLTDSVLETLADPLPSEELKARADEFAPESVLNEYEQFIEKHIVPTSS